MSNKLARAMKSYVNKDVAMSMVNNIIGLIKGPLMMLIIPLYVSEEMQGFWFTITSLSALTTFADLGFGTLVAQFSAHEFANLRFNKNKSIEGEETSIKKLASLFRYVIKWSVCVCIVAYPVIMGIGIAVLNTHGQMSIWLLPWLLYMSTGGLSFITRICNSFFEGCGQIFKNQLNVAITGIITGIVQAVMLIANCGLYALAVTSIISFVVNFVLLVGMYGKNMLQMFRTRCTVNYRWSKYFLSLIWKYAISWAGGYFVFQIYTPLAFMVYDPVVAGKVGITMTLVSACFSIANTLFAVLQPRINMSVAKRDYASAKSNAKKGVLASMALYLVGAGIIALMLGVVKGQWVTADKIINRFMDLPSVSVLLLAWFAQFPINCIAVYGRAYKQEPFMIPSVIGSLLVLGSTLLIVNTLPVEFLFMGFAMTNVLSIVIYAIMYKKLNSKWIARFEAEQDIQMESIRLQNKQDTPPGDDDDNMALLDNVSDDASMVDNDSEEE